MCRLTPVVSRGTDQRSPRRGSVTCLSERCRLTRGRICTVSLGLHLPFAPMGPLRVHRPCWRGPVDMPHLQAWGNNEGCPPALAGFSTRLPIGISLEIWRLVRRMLSTQQGATSPSTALLWRLSCRYRRVTASLRSGGAPTKRKRRPEWVTIPRSHELPCSVPKAPSHR